MERRPELIDYLSVLFRWWRFIVTGTLILVALAILGTFLMTSYYTTEATVLVTKSKVAEEGKESFRTYTEIESYTSLLENKTLYLEAMNRFELRNPPYKMTLNKFSRLVKVRFLPKTDLLSLSFSFPEPELSRQIATFLLEQAIQRNRQLNQSEAVESRDFLAQELDRARTLRDQIQGELATYRKTNDPAVLVGLRDAALKNVEELDRLRRRVRAEVAEGEAFVAEGEKRLESIPEKFQLQSELSQGSTYQQIVSRITGTPIAELLGIPFTVENTNEAFVRIQGDVAYATMKLAGDRAELQRFEEAVAELEAQAEQWNKEAAAQAETIKDLSDRYKTADKLYQELATRYHAATVTVGSRSQDLRIVDAPYTPERASWPRRDIAALIVGQAALLILTLTAFFLEYISHRRSRL